MTTTFLLDVNVLIASIDPGHVAHNRVREWHRQLGPTTWATCPFTQAGFVRIVSNPHFHDQVISVREACELLASLTARPGHRYWAADMTFGEAVARFAGNLSGHKQVSDAYLLGLVISNQGRLVTLDKGIEALAGKKLAQYLEIL